VWNLTLREAAIRSGYVKDPTRDGDTLFVWIFVSNNPEDAVPATWGKVLEYLPKWMDEATAKADSGIEDVGSRQPAISRDGRSAARPSGLSAPKEVADGSSAP